ncbi:hypothetical protein MASR1M32_12240 [Rhodobacter sp.]
MIWTRSSGSRSAPARPASAFLFEAGQPGHWPGGYDPAGGRLWQAATGSPVVTGSGQPVGLVLDQSRGPPLSNLVVNSDFAAGLTNWSAAADSTIAIIGGRLRVGTSLATANGRWGYRAVTTVIGRRYMVRSRLVGMSGGLAYVRAINNLAAPRISEVNANLTAIGETTLIFTASAAVTYLMLGVDGTNLSNSADYATAELWEAPGNHATQPTALSRPTLMQSGGRYHLNNDGGDSLPVTLPAGTYGRATVDAAGAVVIDTVVNPTNVLAVQNLRDIVLRLGAFTPAEEAAIRAHWMRYTV